MSNRMEVMTKSLDNVVAEFDAIVGKSLEFLDSVEPLVSASAILSEYAEQLATNKDWDKLEKTLSAINYLMDLAHKGMPSQK
jgi:hypothetical protein